MQVSIIQKGIVIFYIIILMIASVKDLKTKMIKNWIPMIICILALINRILFATSQIQDVNGNPLYGLIIGGLPFFLIAYTSGKIGGGDIKFMAANGLFLGEIVFLSLLIGVWLGAISFIFLYIITKRKDSTPMAPYLSVGCLFGLYINYFWR